MLRRRRRAVVDELAYNLQGFPLQAEAASSRGGSERFHSPPGSLSPDGIVRVSQLQAAGRQYAADAYAWSGFGRERGVGTRRFQARVPTW